jgi:hypothetical protein
MKMHRLVAAGAAFVVGTVVVPAAVRTASAEPSSCASYWSDWNGSNYLAARAKCGSGSGTYQVWLTCSGGTVYGAWVDVSSSGDSYVHCPSGQYGVAKGYSTK